MARYNAPLITFNRGRFSRLGLARTDLDRVRLSAEIQTNFIPRTLGSMMLRPGLGYLGSVLNDSTARLIPHIRRSTDAYLIELTSGTMRVWSSDVVLTRPNSTAAVTNGTFDSNLTGWTDDDDVGCSSTWITGGYLGLAGSIYGRAARYQTVVASSGNHGISVIVNRGFPKMSITATGGSGIGTTATSTGADIGTYFKETELRPGNYSLGITTTGNFVIRFENDTEYHARIDSVSVESSGDISLSHPYKGTDLDDLRWHQVEDVVFLAGSTNRPRTIERHSAESWGNVEYYPIDGPFRTINTDQTRTMTAWGAVDDSGITRVSGEVTIQCSKPFFRTDHAGSLLQLTSLGQKVEIIAFGPEQWSDPIRVSGITDNRPFSIVRTTFVNSTLINLQVQQSPGEVGNWQNVSTLAFTTTGSTSYDDAQDNEIIYYRIGVGATGYLAAGTTKTAIAAGYLEYDAGGIIGRAQIMNIFSPTESSAIVHQHLGSTKPTDLWNEGSWSDYRGWPTAIALFEQRLMLAGRGFLWGSETGAPEDHDPETIGDSGPIARSISDGPNDIIEWLVPLNRLVIGTQSLEYQAKTTSLEEPLTPTNFTLRDLSTQGSASVQGLKVDRRCFFVQKGRTRLFEIKPTETGLDQMTVDRTVIIPEIGEPAITRMVVQRQPDTRIHCLRSDGTVGMLLSDPAEDVLAWLDVRSTAESGAIEEAAVLPGTKEDAVYYVVRREINGSTKRYLEKWALEDEARGGSTNKIGDSFVIQNSTKTDVISNLDHLVGSSVVVWGATADLGSYTVSSTGTVTANSCSTYFCTALPYNGWYKSAKLAYAAQMGTALVQKKKIDRAGILIADTHAQGLSIGRSTTAVDLIPQVRDGATVSSDTVHSEWDVDMTAFRGTWDTDSRVVLKASAPRPVTALGMVIQIDTKEKG